MTFQFDLDHRVLIETGGSWGRAEGSRGLLICLLAGELTCHGRVLQLHARQRVLYVRQVVSQRGLKLGLGSPSRSSALPLWEQVCLFGPR